MKILCEMSGGADSALAAIYAKKKYEEDDTEFICLFIDYEQEYADQEREASMRLTKKIFKEDSWWSWEMVEVKNLFNSEFDEDEAEKDIVLGPKVVEYFHLRNLVLTSIAASRAKMHGAKVIVTGSKTLVPVEGDSYSFKDSSVPFYTMMEATINVAVEYGRIKIEPLLAMNRTQKMEKVQVYRELLQAGIDLNETWSCYHPNESNKKECGKCRNCKEKEAAIKSLVLK